MDATRTPAQTIAAAIGIGIVLAVIAVSVYFFVFKGPVGVIDKGVDIASKSADEGIKRTSQAYDLAKRIGADIDDVIHFRPIVKSGGTTVMEAKKPIMEVSLVEEPFEHTYTWENTWLGSTKRIKLKGYFVAKAGYDLTKPFSIDVSENGQAVRATMPPAKLNSVEEVKVEVVQDDGGIWNRISQQERQDAMNALLAEAKQSLDKTGIFADADKALMTRLQDAVRKNSPTASIFREVTPLQ